MNADSVYACVPNDTYSSNGSVLPAVYSADTDSRNDSIALMTLFHLGCGYLCRCRSVIYISCAWLLLVHDGLVSDR